MMSDTKPWYRFFGSQARHQVYPVVDELLGRSFLVAVYPEILSGLPLRDQSRTHTPTLPSSSVTWKRTRIGFCCFHQHFFLSTTPFANVQRKWMCTQWLTCGRGQSTTTRRAMCIGIWSCRYRGDEKRKRGEACVGGCGWYWEGKNALLSTMSSRCLLIMLGSRRSIRFEIFQFLQSNRVRTPDSLKWVLERCRTFSIFKWVTRFECVVLECSGFRWMDRRFWCCMLPCWSTSKCSVTWINPFSRWEKNREVSSRLRRWPRAEDWIQWNDKHQSINVFQNSWIEMRRNESNEKRSRAGRWWQKILGCSISSHDQQ